MIRPTPLWRSVAVLGVAGLVLTACGGEQRHGLDHATKPGLGVRAGWREGRRHAQDRHPAAADRSLAFLGPPEFAGVDLAVKDINDAGGVNGKQVEVTNSDSGDTSTDTASQSVDRLLSNNVDAIIGAASSSVSLSVIDKITGAGVLQISPANTSHELTDYADKGLYFRTAPPDVLQGRVLGDLILADGNTTLGILALQDSYGTGLADAAPEVVRGRWRPGRGEGRLRPQGGVLRDRGRQDQGGRPRGDHPDLASKRPRRSSPSSSSRASARTTKKIYFVDGDIANYSKDFPKGTLDRRQGHPAGRRGRRRASRPASMTVDPKLDRVRLRA